VNLCPIVCSSVKGIARVPAKRWQPTLEDHTLTVWYTLPTTINCSHDHSSSRSRAKVWTSIKQSVVRLIRDLHDAVETTVVRCVGFGIVYNRRIEAIETAAVPLPVL